MSDRLFNHSSSMKFNRYHTTSCSSSTDIADSGITSRITPLSSINENRLNINADHDDDDDDGDDNDSITTEKIRSFPMIQNVREKSVLKYKTCVEDMEYPRCLITYIDHPSAIFFQIPNDGRAFQQMHQDMNRHYMDNLNGYTSLMMSSYHVGDFCVAYSTRHVEFYRARILKIDHRIEQLLIIYVDFGDSEWVHMKSIRPLHGEFAQLEVQSIAGTLSRIVPKKDPSTGLINWNTHLSKQCTRKLRRLLIKPVGEPFLFVSIRIVSHNMFWSLPLIEIKIDGQDLADILHYDELARLTRTNDDLRKLFPTFGRHLNEQLIFGLERCENNRSSMIDA